jgi:hypothetical protein
LNGKLCAIDLQGTLLRRRLLKSRRRRTCTRTSRKVGIIDSTF